MGNDSFLLPPWAVKRNGQAGIILREETVKDIEGNTVRINPGDKVMVVSFNQGGVNPDTGRIYADEVFCGCYVVGTYNPRVFYIRAEHVHLPEAYSNTQTYTDINALEYFKQAMLDENGRQIKTLHELNFNEDQEESNLIKHVLGED